MNDKKGAKGITSTLQNWTNVQDLLKIGLNNKTAIRSEIYLQIYKQISHNTNLYVGRGGGRGGGGEEERDRRE